MSKGDAQISQLIMALATEATDIDVVRELVVLACALVDTKDIQLAAGQVCEKSLKNTLKNILSEADYWDIFHGSDSWEVQ